MNSSLIQFLQDPDVYPHSPEQVEHIQTHISHVFMAGSYVYKVKKAVNFDFLDFSTLDKRKSDCEREVKLNRRLCEDTYLDVVTISRDRDSYELESKGEGEVIEYAVKMKRLPQQYFLHTSIDDGELSLQQLDRVADKLANFYQGQDVDDEILKWGQIDKIKYNTDENFRQTRPFLGDTIDKNSFDAIRRYTNRYFERYESLFNQRIAEKRIVDGHGDLHLEHIHIMPDKVRIFDCIEFNDRFRYGDVAEDLAYLAMDLDFNNCRKEERYFVEKMAEKLEDESLTRHINFYKCYRAYVKGKVKSLQSSEEEVEAEDRKKARKTAANYFDLSLRYALLGSAPAVLVVMGRTGTGKSTLAKYLSKKLSVPRFSSDRIRKTLMDIPLGKRVSASKREELYASEVSARTYRRLREEAGQQISQRKNVILDATFSKKEQRANVIKLAKSQGVRCFFIEACASDDTITGRLKSRESMDEVVSDARLEDFEDLDQYYDHPTELAEDQRLKVSTESSIEESISQLYEELTKRNLRDE